nr:MASE1 domain-containing protein [Streptomyces sp. SID5469]
MWPPTGIALASPLLGGPRVWPGIALGALLVNVSLGPSVWAVLVIVSGNTLAPVCSYILLRRTGFRLELDRSRDALALIFLGAFTGMLVSATTGSGTLAHAGVLSADQFWPTWSVWCTGDAMGVLVVTPVLLVLRSAHRPKDAPPTRWVEGLLLLAATSYIGFLETGSTPLRFLGFPSRSGRPSASNGPGQRPAPWPCRPSQSSWPVYSQRLPATGSSVEGRPVRTARGPWARSLARSP